MVQEINRLTQKFCHSCGEVIFKDGIKVLMAKNYIDNLKEETMKGLREKAAQGNFPCKAPVGYKNITDKSGKKIIVLDEQKAMYIKRAFELYATANYSLTRLARKLYEDGFRTPAGLQYAKSSIENLLKNIFYTGVFEYEGKRYENANHKSIISSELFYLVQSKLRDPRKVRSHDVEFPYTNFIQCGHCGCFLTAELKKEKYIYYHCTGNHGGNCKKDYVRQKDIEENFVEVLKGIKISEDLIVKIMGSIKELHKQKNVYNEETTESIERQIKTLQKRIEQAYIDKVDGNISNEFWKEKNTSWHEQKDELINKLKILNNSDNKFYESSNRILEFCKDAHSLFLGANNEEKRNILNLVCSNSVYKDKELSIELNSVFSCLAETVNLENLSKNSDRTQKNNAQSGFETDKDAILENLSPGWTRTSNPSVNSRMLCH